MPADSPSHIGHWVQGRLLGRGGSGRVYLAQLSDGRPAACKVINTDGIAQDDTSSLMGEIALIRELRHENIVRYLGYDHDKHAHQLHIFLEYAHGGSLQQLTKTVGALDEATSRHFAAQILSGLKYLHAHGIAHRDIKGANVLLSTVADFPSSIAAHHKSHHQLSFVAKLADFGASKQIAEMLDPKQQQAPSSGLKGTPHWMAPEVIRGELSAGSLGDWTRADVWSVGCTTVEMLTGEMPWPRIPNPMAAMYKIAEGHTPPMDHITTSRAARIFVSACCCSCAAERPSPAELLRHPFIVRISRNCQDKDIIALRKRIRNIEDPGEIPPTCAGMAAMRHYHGQHRRQRETSAQICTNQDQHDHLMLQSYGHPRHPQSDETPSSSVAKRSRGGGGKLRRNNSRRLPPMFAGAESKRPLHDPDGRHCWQGGHRVTLVDNTLGRFGEAMLTQLDASHQRSFRSIAARQSRSAGLQDLGKPAQQLPPIQAVDRRQINTAPNLIRNADQARKCVEQQGAAAEHRHLAQLRHCHYRQGSACSPSAATSCAGTALTSHPGSGSFLLRHQMPLFPHDHHLATSSMLPHISSGTSVFGGLGSNLAACAAQH